jgi:hypothetical protein
MCFRPPEAKIAKTCPECGLENDAFATSCAKCGAALPEQVLPPIAGAPGAPKMPGSPGMPGVPKMPGAPGVPGMSKAPGAPKAPGV